MHYCKLEVNRFWNTCGAHICRLWLKHCCLGSESYVTKVFLSWTVNMEEFYLEGVGFCSPEYQYVNFPTYTVTGPHSLRRRSFEENIMPTPVLELVTDHSDSDDEVYYDSETELFWPGNCNCEWGNTKAMKTFRLEQHIVNNHNQKMKCFVTDARIPLRWKDIVRVYPNLEILEVTNQDGIAKQLLLELTDFKKNGLIVLPRLTELRVFHGYVKEEITQNLKIAMHLDFPIRKFKLRHISHGTREQQFLAVNYMAKLIKNNLEELEMDSGFEMALFPPTTGPIQYPKLKKLTTYSCYLDTPGCEFLNRVPGLKILQLTDDFSMEEYRCISMRITHTVTPILLPSLVKLTLQIPCRNFSLSCQNIRQLSEWFPNLKHFTGSLTDDHLFLTVAECFGNRLVTLEFSADGITDRGFTGYVYDWSNGTENRDGHKAAKLQKMSSGQAVASASSRSLGIRQMIKLQRLKINMDDKTLSNLTDACIFNGLIHLPELRTLELIEFGTERIARFQITKTALKYYCDLRNLHTLMTPKYYRTLEPFSYWTDYPREKI